MFSGPFLTVSILPPTQCIEGAVCPQEKLSCLLHVELRVTLLSYPARSSGPTLSTDPLKYLPTSSRCPDLSVLARDGPGPQQVWEQNQAPGTEGPAWK